MSEDSDPRRDARAVVINLVAYREAKRWQAIAFDVARVETSIRKVEALLKELNPKE